MLVYPQLGTGALSQFPIRKQRRMRTVVNTASDGSSIKLADPAGETTAWQLAYAGLTDGEIAALEQFFASAEGSLNGFTFVDPTANLLAWSGQLGNSAWARGPALSVTGGIADPAGGALAWRLTNQGAAAQTISQTLAAPGAYVYCLSAYARAATAGTVTMFVGANRADRTITTQWSRIVFTASGNASAASIGFGLEMPAGAVVDVFGIQAEAQAGASTYKSSTASGVYENARLLDDELKVTSNDVNSHSCTVNIIHVNDL
ncbi:MAG: hypothetical protein ABSC23_08730 [Bryobacteraceae bacterium]|jgi:hypothetical protein